MKAGSGPIWGSVDHRDFARVHDPRILSAIRFLRANLHRPGTVSDTAAEIGLSPSRLWHLCQAQAGSSPRRMLLHLRLERATELLSTSELTLKEVAAAIGMKHVAALGRAFRARYDVTPGRFRRERLQAEMPPAGDASPGQQESSKE